MRILFGLFIILAPSGALELGAAGDLDPPDGPVPTMRTLDEIYEAVGPIDPNLTLPLPEAVKVEGTDMMHLFIGGVTQGEIHGSCTEAGLEHSIVVGSIAHEITVPRDAASGLPTGKRQHSPLIITKRIDQSTPLLYLALTQNETLANFELRFYRINGAGIKEHYFTIELMNARISKISRGGRDEEELSFVYQRIRWTWEDGGITAEDDWETPVA
jgi:type VI secretion system secreted protein Hcp